MSCAFLMKLKPEEFYNWEFSNSPGLLLKPDFITYIYDMSVSGFV